MAKKSQPVVIKIVGSQQAANIEKAFLDKETAKIAAEAYETSRNAASPTILSKIIGYWAKMKGIHTGSYVLQLPDGSTRKVVTQNRQSTKTYEPADAKATIDALNAHTTPNAPLRMADIYAVKTKHILNEDAMLIPKIRDRVVGILTALEAELKAEQTLAPEIALIVEDKKLVLAKHALARTIALSTNFEDAVKVLGNPVTVNLVDSEESKD